MPYPIEKKLVVGVSSNALFNLEFEDNLFLTEGLTKYRDYQLANLNKKIDKGLAFPFIKRFLNINNIYTEEQPVEVVLLSKNSPETGIRIFNSIEEYNLNITRAAFVSGRSPYEYIPAYNISLFLSTNDLDVSNSIKAGFPAGRFLRTSVVDSDIDNELRVAFDFDGVIIDDESEAVYKKTDELKLFHDHEVTNLNKPHNPGPLAEFFKKLSYFQKMESKKEQTNTGYKKLLRTAIITARNAPSHTRAVNTLKEWGITVDELHLLGGIEKRRILETFKPQIYFDDQTIHLDPKLKDIPLVHIPFGVANSKV
ncbi:MAG: 5'-nucleotidase [Ignavibacteria bacterium]|nr:5'-nucleotidase [Ignavibacteria bacterium]